MASTTPPDRIFRDRVERLVRLVERWAAQLDAERQAAWPERRRDEMLAHRLNMLAESALDLLRARDHLREAADLVRRAAERRRRTRDAGG